MCFHLMAQCGVAGDMPQLDQGLPLEWRGKSLVTISGSTNTSFDGGLPID